MGKLTPVKRIEFINRLRGFGFKGPYPGGKHLYMIKGDFRLTIYFIFLVHLVGIHGEIQ